MVQSLKGKSPFYPGQPVPRELFAGRIAQIQHIVERGVKQVANGKPVAMYVQGEYGIGKSSIAGFVQWLAEQEYGLHGIYVPLGPTETLDGVGSAVLGETIRSGAFHPTRSEKVRAWLARYVGEQSLAGITIHTEALRQDAPTLASASGILPFLREAVERLQETGVKGILLILDEINGIASNPKFAHFIKGIVDTNAMSSNPLPLLLMLCGVEERRQEMIRHHQPVDRIFDVIEIAVMSTAEMKDFFERAFASVQMRVESEAMDLMIEHSAGFPKIMHLVGDAAFWRDQDGIISKADAFQAVFDAADEVGKKYVDQQVYKALRSKDYRSILSKIARTTPSSMSFQRADIVVGLTDTERKKFGNFLRKMRDLKVLRLGDVSGEYVFNVRMVRLYIWLQSFQETTAIPASSPSDK